MVERAGRRRVSEAEKHLAKLGHINRLSSPTTAEAAALVHVSSKFTEVLHKIFPTLRVLQRGASTLAVHSVGSAFHADSNLLSMQDRSFDSTITFWQSNLGAHQLEISQYDETEREDIE